jgi:predicted ester cyclase
VTLAVTETQQTIVSALNDGNIAGAGEAFHPDSHIHINGGPKRDLTLSEFKEMLAGLLAALPDLRITIDDQFTAGDRVATRWSAEGTHNGPLGSLDPTGRKVTIEALIMDRYVDGKIADRWELWDQAWLLQQLGAM